MLHSGFSFFFPFLTHTLFMELPKSWSKKKINPVEDNTMPYSKSLPTSGKLIECSSSLSYISFLHATLVLPVAAAFMWHNKHQYPIQLFWGQYQTNSQSKYRTTESLLKENLGVLKSLGSFSFAKSDTSGEALHYCKWFYYINLISVSNKHKTVSTVRFWSFHILMKLLLLFYHIQTCITYC